jgi:hypothetical protein
VLYEPGRHGHEAAVADRLADLRERRRRAGSAGRRTDGGARPEDDGDDADHDEDGRT